ncbi:MAG: MaoC family dehydratase [Lachnospiraceae bacterium]|nr:MaoC family dehydratase [Lachnospiraceae bacterium]
MNEYRFSDLKIGTTESFEHTVTAEEMDLFLKISGDENPLHSDSNFAKAHGFSDRVVYGMLSSSLVSTLGGMYLPGRYCIIQQVELKFVAPVFVGDTLTVKGEVKELNESVQQAVMGVEIRNQDGKKVVRGKLFTGFLE